MFASLNRVTAMRNGLKNKFIFVGQLNKPDKLHIHARPCYHLTTTHGSASSHQCNSGPCIKNHGPLLSQLHTFSFPINNFNHVKCFSDATKSQDKSSGGKDGSEQTASQVGDAASSGTSQDESRTTAPLDDLELLDENLTVFQRFKNTYKKHGKVLISVHLLTSSVWGTLFYMMAHSGIDLIPLLDMLGAGESMKKVFATYGDFAVAYALYKLATPVRYSVTLGGTYMTLRWLRGRGYLVPVPVGDSFRGLMKDGRQEMKDKVKVKREDMKDKMDDFREDMKSKVKDVKKKR